MLLNYAFSRQIQPILNATGFPSRLFCHDTPFSWFWRHSTKQNWPTQARRAEPNRQTPCRAKDPPSTRPKNPPDAPQRKGPAKQEAHSIPGIKRAAGLLRRPLLAALCQVIATYAYVPFRS